jgi:transcriptional regulator with XRE-family HTH domain
MEVRGIIKEKGWTIEKVASEMGINRVTLSQNLSGNPTVKTLQRIADVIGCRVGDFFRDDMSGGIAQEPPKLVCPHCGKEIKIALE